MAPNNSEDLAYMKYFHSDLLLSTEGWATFERVLYLWLLVANWNHGPLPTSQRALANICGVSLKEFDPIWRTRIRRKFKKTKGGLENERIARDRDAGLRAKTKSVVDGHNGGVASAKARGFGLKSVGELVANFPDRMKATSK